MTEGDPKKLILSFAIPIFISQLFQQFYNITDVITSYSIHYTKLYEVLNLS